MKSKKVTLAIMIGALVFALTGCGTGGSGSQTAQTADSDAGSGTASARSIEDILGDFDTSATIEPTVLMDANNIKITADSLTYSQSSVNFAFTVENNTEQTQSVVCESVGYSVNAVNQYMIEDGYANLEVAPGQSGSKVISIDKTELILHGIKGVAEFQTGFSVTDDSYDTIYTGPVSVKTSLAEKYDSAGDSFIDAKNNGLYKILYGFKVDFTKDDTLLDKNNFRVVSATLIRNDDDKAGLLMEVENNTAETAYARFSNVSVNGITLRDSICKSATITAGKRIVVNLTLSELPSGSATLEELGITSIDNIKFEFQVYGGNYKELVKTEEISVDR